MADFIEEYGNIIIYVLFSVIVVNVFANLFAYV